MCGYFYNDSDGNRFWLSLNSFVYHKSKDEWNERRRRKLKICFFFRPDASTATRYFVKFLSNPAGAIHRPYSHVSLSIYFRGGRYWIWLWFPIIWRRQQCLCANWEIGVKIIKAKIRPLSVHRHATGYAAGLKRARQQQSKTFIAAICQTTITI